ncbi:23S rRNA pseudouridine955/2504/2580 synthase [Treponema bryantii]|uniref:23S rRNA pseudouridine955/2504/2580 synthase n=1 Tax=Treponema bryantii TaxID=163 RepID=A0A1I3J1K9_9SPIR|nr:RluA family pseudouridine synthase [Treponema bryantii]SFI54107.1 23S rRNA pseudouridine955/2504/2580 synthase [Treponema bryantii]
MEFRDFTAGKDDDGRRLDRVLRIFLENLSMGEIYKLLRKGLIKVNNKKAKADTHVSQGDVISIAEFLFNSESKSNVVTAHSPVPSSENLNIVFENEHLLIIDKPYGRSVHGSEKEKDAGLDKEVTAYYEAKSKEEKEKSLSFRPGPLHRLDKNTTGLLVFSKSLEGAHWFSEGIKNHTIHKKYYGIAEGNLAKTEEWEDKLSDSDTTEQGFYTVSQNTSGLLAQTTAKPLAHGKLAGHDITLVEYAIKTGRKHQIRAQSKIHGHPLAGDTAYSGHKDKLLKREYYLQAYSLSFPANPLGLPPEIKIELSSDFLDLLRCCEIKNPGL